MTSETCLPDICDRQASSRRYTVGRTPRRAGGRNVGYDDTMNRYRDWLDQARGDLSHAANSLSMGDHAWACFAAHQAAEAAVKGLHMNRGQVAWGHSVAVLLRKLPEDLLPERKLLNAAKTLDRHYIPARYPDAHPAGPTQDNYTDAEAREAIARATEILEYCERQSLDH